MANGCTAYILMQVANVALMAPNEPRQRQSTATAASKSNQIEYEATTERI